MALKRGDREYNADTNDWVVKKKKAATSPAKAESKPAATKKKKAKVKPPVPKKRSVKDKVKVPKGPQKERKGIDYDKKNAYTINTEGAAAKKSDSRGKQLKGR